MRMWGGNEDENISSGYCSFDVNKCYVGFGQAKLRAGNPLKFINQFWLVCCSLQAKVCFPRQNLTVTSVNKRAIGPRTVPKERNEFTDPMSGIL